MLNGTNMIISNFSKCEDDDKYVNNYTFIFFI